MFRSLVRINQHQVLNRTVNFSKRSASTTPAISEVINKWNKLSTEEQNNITKQFDELQKQDWQRLSLEEKKTAYYISFGNTGPREFYNTAPHTGKVIAGIIGLIGISSGFFYLTKSAVTEHPKTLTKEWQEATNQRMREQKVNPISGVSSEGYTGKGYVTSK
ncbi:cytochrome c oxidase subunit IV [Glomus cerebriforme]|uniref:Cytochrome c oxidase subunit IV n=1 Tax=Glomus cerebriforme TaxID=658196 RepID=A0A397SU30_9GLOM|nr:cytochrome c oxidase subunit IV [Glomus cerebriforme]